MSTPSRDVQLGVGSQTQEVGFRQSCLGHLLCAPTGSLGTTWPEPEGRSNGR